MPTIAAIILRFGEEMNVLRISVNVGNSLGASGFETHLAPTMTIGTGYFGRSSVCGECRAATSGAMGEARLETRPCDPSFDAVAQKRASACRPRATSTDFGIIRQCTRRRSESGAITISAITPS